MKLAAVFTILALTPLVQAFQAQILPDGPGKDTVTRICGDCHDANVLNGMKQTRAEWAITVNQMAARGAAGSDAELDIVVEYLARFFGKDDSPKKIDINSASAKEIGAALELASRDSDAIVAYRQKNGNFKDWRDLARVDGIDLKAIEARRDRITF